MFILRKIPFLDFNPRSPHRERLGMLIMWHFVHEFQSTLPSQGATADSTGQAAKNVISIHAPLTGSDHE